jgi:hypothetical protein
MAPPTNPGSRKRIAMAKAKPAAKVSIQTAALPAATSPASDSADNGNNYTSIFSVIGYTGMLEFQWFKSLDMAKKEEWVEPATNPAAAADALQKAIEIRIAEKAKYQKSRNFPIFLFDYSTTLGVGAAGWGGSFEALASCLGFGNTNLAIAWLYTTEGKFSVPTT